MTHVDNTRKTSETALRERRRDAPRATTEGGRSEREKTETYSCHNAGCPNGQWSSFLDYPEAFWKNEQQSCPKSCHDCRLWKRKQEAIADISARCAICQAQTMVTDKFRIAHHRYHGSWKEHWAANSAKHQCKVCRGSADRERMQRAKRAKSTYIHLFLEAEEERKRHPFMQQFYVTATEKAREMGFFDNVEAFDASDDPWIYCDITLSGTQRERHGDTELDHIMKEDHEWLDALGTDRPEDVVATLAALAASTDPYVLQARSGDSIVKADTSTGLVVILTNRPHPNAPEGWRIRTGYMAAKFDDYFERHLLNKILGFSNPETDQDTPPAWLPC